MNKSYEEVTDIAKKFLEKAGYTISRIDSIKPETTKNIWIVTVAFGIVQTYIKVLKIKDEDGSIIGFE